MLLIDFITRLVLACAAGLVIGIERYWHQKAAGLKTNMLVSTGAAIFVLIFIKIAEQETNSDVSRIVAQVVTGVGFLGAGVIFREGTNMHGLTSVATMIA